MTRGLKKADLEVGFFFMRIFSIGEAVGITVHDLSWRGSVLDGVDTRQQKKFTVAKTPSRRFLAGRFPLPNPVSGREKPVLDAQQIQRILQTRPARLNSLGQVSGRAWQSCQNRSLERYGCVALRVIPALARVFSLPRLWLSPAAHARHLTSKSRWAWLESCPAVFLSENTLIIKKASHR